jgi:hypothetical protein
MSAASGREEWTKRGHASIAKLLGEDALGQGMAGVEHHEDVDLSFLHHLDPDDVPELFRAA